MSDQVLLLLEKDRVIDTITQLFISTDRRDWPAVRRCFADTVLFDRTSLAGGTPGRLSPEQIASHYRSTRSGRNTRVFVGSYDFHLLRIDGRWRIDSFRFNLKYVDGNARLEQEG